MDRRTFLATLLVANTQAKHSASVTHGPLIGHLTSSTAKLWARLSGDGTYRLVISDLEGSKVASVNARSSVENDQCVVWEVKGLKPSQTYRYMIDQAAKRLIEGQEFTFQTSPSEETRTQVKLAFGSCANDSRYPSQPIWTRMKREGAQAVIVLGDTPYIDSTDLSVQRRRYREFYSVPELASMFRNLPFLGVWDDHDFGANNSTGNLAGKQSSRRAFVNYHANPSYGEGQDGIYTKLRWGPVEIFLLDTRWFAETEPSPVSSERPTLLGRAQWNWLKRELSSSTAPFKILASGMIWNGPIHPSKLDHWMSYPHERDALFHHIGANKISGVVLMSGDIHRSRLMRYPTEDTVGYPLTELITSPLANTVEDDYFPSPYLLQDVIRQYSFLLLTVDNRTDPPTLLAQCMDHEGKVLFSVQLNTEMLSRKPN